MNGKIKKIVGERGFGFIKREDNGKDIFFHAKSLANVQFEEIQEGDSVTFETQETEKGTQAVKVCRP